MPMVTVRFYAQLREQRGRDSEELSVAEGESVGALYDRLFPPTAAGQLPVGYAVNASYTGRDTPLSEGDEVVFVPPVGGG